MGPRYDLSFCACTTAYLASELLVSIGPSLHLWFLHAKLQLLDQNYKSLSVLDLTCCFAHANSVNSTSLYGSPPSPVDVDCKIATFGPPYKSLWVPDLTCRLCIQNSDIRTKIARLYGSQTSPVNFCIQNSMPSIRIISLYRSQTSSVVFACKTA